MPVCVFGQQSFTLNGAIAESMNYVANKLPDKTKVVILKVKAPNTELTEYITVECENYISNNTSLALVNKKSLPDILKRNNIADLYKVEESEIFKVAGLLGANDVIFVEFDKHGELYSFLIRAFDVESAQIKAMLALHVELDKLLADFIGETYISSEKLHEKAQYEELARIEKELEELKVKISTQDTSQSQNQSDFDAQIDAIANILVDKTQNNESNAYAPEEKRENKESGKYFVFSVRNEFLTGNGAMGFGGDIELGVIAKNGFYFSTDFNSGVRYFGGGFNFGACINKDGAIKGIIGITTTKYGEKRISLIVKSVLGITTGFWIAPVSVDVYRGGVYYATYTDYNISFCGAFWKFMLGRKGNIDLTNKALLGVRREIDYSDKHLEKVNTYPNITYSVSAGFTLTKKK